MTNVRVKEIRDLCRQEGSWVAWDTTCDRVLYGDPETEIEALAVAWMATFSTLERARALGCNAFVTHEPLYLAVPAEGGLLLGGSSAAVLAGQGRCLFDPDDAWARKREWLDETGMVVYRCHDFWDDYPGVGIHGAWASALGLTDSPVETDRFYELHAVDGTLGELARQVLRHARRLGQESVHVVGDLATPVSVVALGTGAITDYRTMAELGADVLLVTDDGTRLWESAQWSLDAGVPLIVVNHATAEEPGMETLAQYFRDRVPGLPVHHIPVGCLYATLTE